MRASAIIVKNKKVLLIHRKRDSEEYWIFPGGSIEGGETKEEAIKREVSEETSLEVTGCKYSFDYKDEKGICHPVFLCDVSSGKPTIAAGSPESECHSNKDWYHPEWVNLNRAVKLNMYPDEGKKVLESMQQK